MATVESKRVSPAALSALERALRREIASYEQYLQVAANEREAIVRGNPDEIMAFTEERSGVLQAIESAGLERERAVQAMWGERSVDGQVVPLRELVVKSLPENQVALLSPLVDTLRSLVTRAREEAKEHQAITEYSYRVLHSVASLALGTVETPANRYTKSGTLTSTSPGVATSVLSSLRRV